MSRVIVDMHGARAREGVDIDALENFLAFFRGALREFSRANQGAIARKGGRPFAREVASSAFRLVEFRIGSGIATLAPSLPATADTDDLPLDDTGEPLPVTTLRGLLGALEADDRLPELVVEALGSARKAIGEDGSFGVKVTGRRQAPRVVIDENRMSQLQHPEPAPTDANTVDVTGRLHMIEVNPPNRRVGILAPDGVDWTCTYPDRLHPLVTNLVERLVRITGTGRRMTATTGRLVIDRLEPIAEHVQDALFTVETVPEEQLRAEQSIAEPQGLGALVDEEWSDDDESRRFLEATLGTVQHS